MNARWTFAALAVTVLWLSILPAQAMETLFLEDFDGPNIQAGQSILDEPLNWTLIAPTDAANQRVGNVFVGSDRCPGMSGNCLDGATAAAADIENLFLKRFPAVATGRVVLSCRVVASGAKAEGSSISVLPGQSRFIGRGAGWAATADGWTFWSAAANSTGYPLLEKKVGPVQTARDSFTGGHDTVVQLTTTVDLDKNEVQGHAQWTDAQGKPREHTSPVFGWDSAPGNAACVLVDIDKRGGRTGIAIDDVRVEGQPAVAQPHPFENEQHTVLQLDGDNKPAKLPAEIQWISKPWDGLNAQMPYLVYMPEKDRLLMLVYVGTGQPNLIASNDHGKTWSQPLWTSPPQPGQPDVGLLGLTYLGGGRLLAYPESLADCWGSSDYGQTWAKVRMKVPDDGLYTWDPLLVVQDADGKVKRIAQGCWKPTGVPWGSADGFYSQAYFRSSADEGKTWTTVTKVPQWLGVNEVLMLVAANGDWVAACRTDYPRRFAHHAFDHYGGLAVSISRDEGKTWSALSPLYEWGRHHPSMVLLPNGSILMSYVVRLGYPHTEQGFPQFGVEAVVSRDHGQTWDLAHRYVLAEWTGSVKGEDDWYGGVQSSSTIRLPDGTLLTAFGMGIRNMPSEERCIMDVGLVRWRMK